MAQSVAPEYRSGDLLVNADTGQVRNLEDGCVRLGPVKMKVLIALLQRPGEVVTRGEIFDAVWGNQVISEDALTRCVSDIRADLKKLSERDDLIETLPKRGYRWIAPVHEVTGPASSNARNSDAALPADSPSYSARTQIRPGRLLFTGAVYLLALAAAASLIVWAIDQISGPGPAVIAVLPISASAAEQEMAAQIENTLIEHLIGRENIEVLSRSAVDSRPANPFPFFYFEFGARWLIETQLRKTDAQVVLSMSIVDARTGIVQLQSTTPVDRGDNPAQHPIVEISSFIESHNSGSSPGSSGATDAGRRN